MTARSRVPCLRCAALPLLGQACRVGCVPERHGLTGWDVDKSVIFPCTCSILYDSSSVLLLLYPIYYLLACLLSCLPSFATLTPTHRHSQLAQQQQALPPPSQSEDGPGKRRELWLCEQHEHSKEAAQGAHERVQLLQHGACDDVLCFFPVSLRCDAVPQSGESKKEGKTAKSRLCVRICRHSTRRNIFNDMNALVSRPLLSRCRRRWQAGAGAGAVPTCACAWLADRRRLTGGNANRETIY